MSIRYVLNFTGGLPPLNGYPTDSISSRRTSRAAASPYRSTVTWKTLVTAA